MLEFGIITAIFATIITISFYIYDKSHPTSKAH